MAGVSSALGIVIQAIRRSKIFSTWMDTFFTILGAMVDMLLIPLIPILFPALMMLTKTLPFLRTIGEGLKFLATINNPIELANWFLEFVFGKGYKKMTPEDMFNYLFGEKGTITTFWNDMWAKNFKIWNDMVAELKKAWDGVIAWFKSGWDTVVAWIKSGWDLAIAWIKSGWDGAIKWIQDAWNWVKDVGAWWTGSEFYKAIKNFKWPWDASGWKAPWDVGSSNTSTSNTTNNNTNNKTTNNFNVNLPPTIQDALSSLNTYFNSRA